ncbi:MAG: HPr family phosphocarrier protein, partial [Pseudomonadota bacterium]
MTSGGVVDGENAGAARRRVVIRNRRGLHARASAKLAAVAGEYDAVVRVRRDDMDVGALSIMGLLMLGAGRGSEIELVATGPQAHAALDALIQLIEDRF